MRRRRRPASGEPWSASARERREADLFFADLIGRPMSRRAPVLAARGRVTPSAAGQEAAWPVEQESVWPVEVEQETAGPVEQETAWPAEQEPAWPVEQETAWPAEQETAWPVEQAAAAPPVVPVFPGLDISAWDPQLIWFWRWSNLRFIGFYLAHHAGQTRTTWTSHWHDLQDVGWGLVPFYLPFSSAQIAQMATADGTAHGQEAVARARAARLEAGAAIYLDIESAVLGGANTAGFTRYINNWCAAVRGGGYTPGAYCSRLDASRILGAAFQANRPVVFPFSIPARTRAQWDDARHQLTPHLPSTWDVGTDPAWATNANAIGSQYDWFNAQRDRKVYHWVNAAGANAGTRDVDWDVAKVWNPSHPRAGATVTVAPDRSTVGVVRIFTVATDRIDFRDVPAAGGFPAARNLGLGPADIGPVPAATESAFDAASAAACSRRGGVADLFVQGLDGIVRTAWITDREAFPQHPWPLHPEPARRGTPIAAVCREVDQIDVFYVNREHQLVTQWWSQRALDWRQNRRVLPGPLVAGGSNLAAVKRAAGQAPRSQLDVFYVSLDYSQPFTAWNDAWRVVHATWSQSTDWVLLPIRGLDQPAAASGVAAAGDAWGRLNVVVQTRDRRTLRHAFRTAATGSTWDVGDGPGPLPADRDVPMWWMTFGLAVFENLLLLVGITNTGTLAWATHTPPRVWSGVRMEASQFSTGRPIALAHRGHGLLDVVGVSEDGAFVRRTFEIFRDGRVVLQPAP